MLDSFGCEGNVLDLEIAFIVEKRCCCWGYSNGVRFGQGAVAFMKS